MKTDTIAAIATAMTNSGIGIIRVSGEEAFEVVDRIYRPRKGNKKISEMDSHTVHYGHIVDGDEVIDEVLILLLKAPRSYTTEDTVEIDCHGGTLVMKKILETVLKHGARPAEPGEFTKRAFLNGRIDLSQAESVIDIINAKNDMALKSSVSQLQGVVLEKIRDIRAGILHELAFIESAIDDPEHYTLDEYSDELYGKMKEAKDKVQKMLDSADNGKMLREGIDTAIVGKPNAGKSSLLNVLVGEERAIVTEIAGTTRDILQEQIQIGGIGLNVIDTAGIRDTDDVVEKIGVSKAIEQMEKADLIIYVVDSSVDLDENDTKIMEAIKDRKAIVLLNKSDLEPKVTKDMMSQYVDQKVITISAKERDGIEKVESTIETMFFNGKLSFNDQVYITNIRQKNSLREANDSLALVLQSIQDGMPEDFFTIDMMSAYESLGSIIGEEVGEDLVNEIFSKFCMGK